MHIGEAGDEPAAARVHFFGTGRRAHAVGRADVGDALSVGEHGGVCRGLSGAHIDERATDDGRPRHDRTRRRPSRTMASPSFTVMVVVIRKRLMYRSLS